MTYTLFSALIGAAIDLHYLIPIHGNFWVKVAWHILRFFVLLVCNYEVVTRFLPVSLIGITILKMLNSYLSKCLLNNARTAGVTRKKYLFSSLIKVKIILQIGNDGIQPLAVIGFAMWFTINIATAYITFVCYSQLNNSLQKRVLLAGLSSSTVMLTFAVDWTLSYIVKVSQVTGLIFAEMCQIIATKSSGSWTRRVFRRKVKAIKPICLEAGFLRNRLVLINPQTRILYMETLLSKTANVLISFPIR